MAAAGVDASNVAAGHGRAAARGPGRHGARACVSGSARRPVATWPSLVTDTAGRAWRDGQTDIAIGAAGLEPLDDHAGRVDGYGNELAVTAPAVADELAALAELVSGKLGGRPVCRRARAGATGCCPPGDARPGRGRPGAAARAGHVRARRPRGRASPPCAATDADCFGAPAPRPTVLARSRPAACAAAASGALGPGGAAGRRVATRWRPSSGAAGRARPRLAAAAATTARRTPSPCPHRSVDSARTHPHRPTTERSPRGQEERPRTERARRVEQMRTRAAAQGAHAQPRHPRRLRRPGRRAARRRAGPVHQGPAREGPHRGQRRWPSSVSSPSAAGVRRRRRPRTADGSGPAHADRHPDQLPGRPAGVRPALGQLPAGLGDPHLLHPEDRPELERLVHNLEHGYTILWYDDTVKAGTRGVRADPGDRRQVRPRLPDKFIAAPWTSKETAARSPSGKHVALHPLDRRRTRRSRASRQYCAEPAARSSTTS